MLSRQYDCSENGSCGMWTELRVIIRQDSEKERERVHFTCHQSNPSQSVPPHVGTHAHGQDVSVKTTQFRLFMSRFTCLR